jgi:cyclophilin family peptidyl-prolyl cis-trans isomerase/uncharacterized protein YkwD
MKIRPGKDMEPFETKRRYRKGIIPGRWIVLWIGVWAFGGLWAPAGGQAASVPTDLDQYLVELINRGRSHPAGEAARHGTDLNEGLAAGTITTDPKQPLAFNPRLLDAAQNHSQWMLDNDTFSHTGAGGSTPAARMTAAGYVFSPPYALAENIGYRGSTGLVNAVQEVALIHQGLYIDADVAGRGHRLNQMNPGMKEIGIGVKQGVFSQQAVNYNTVMVTEDFAVSAGSANGWSFITGIAWKDVVVNDGFYTPGGEGIGGITITATNRSTLAAYTTTTWASGGYSLAVPAGTYDVAAAGAGLGGTVAYGPVAVGDRNVKVDFMPDQAAAGPEVTVFGLTDIANNDASPSRAKGTDWGSVGQGRPVLRQTFTVRNDGGSPLTLGPVALPAGYTLIEGLAPSIAPGSSDTFTVRLDTAAAGTYKGIISFATNDPDEAPFGFAVTGRVNPPGTGTALVFPLGDICAGQGDAVAIDLHQHFDDIGVDGTIVRMAVNTLGAFDIELTDSATPVTAANFLAYVGRGDFTDMFIHRAVTTPKYPKDFLIQGGGYGWVVNPEDPDDQGYFDIPVDAPIVNEFANWFNPDYGGLAPGTPVNVRWTLAMAKVEGEPDSATSQFFVNLADNSANLDHQNDGFTVFGAVVRGQPVIEAIADLPVATFTDPFGDLPMIGYSGGAVKRQHLVVFNSVAVVDELAFTVAANSNPGLVAPVIGADGILTVTTSAGQTGAADITVRATDLDGATVEDSFQIVVCADPAAAKGDINGDAVLGLDDAIGSLRLITGSPGLPAGLNARRACVDVNADGRLGLEEAMAVLQKLAAVR